MGRFKSDNRQGFGGRREGGFRGRSSGGFGRSRGFGGDRNRRRVEMHDAVCDKCGKECQVPFRPTEGKPVLCSDCFKQSGGGRGSFGSRDRDGQSSSGISSEQLNQINAKLDRIIKALEL